MKIGVLLFFVEHCIFDKNGILDEKLRKEAKKSTRKDIHDSIKKANLFDLNDNEEFKVEEPIDDLPSESVTLNETHLAISTGRQKRKRQLDLETKKKFQRILKNETKHERFSRILSNLQFYTDKNSQHFDIQRASIAIKKLGLIKLEKRFIKDENIKVINKVLSHEGINKNLKQDLKYIFRNYSSKKAIKIKKL